MTIISAAFGEGILFGISVENNDKEVVEVNDSDDDDSTILYCSDASLSNKNKLTSPHIPVVDVGIDVFAKLSALSNTINVHSIVVRIRIHKKIRES